MSDARIARPEPCPPEFCAPYIDRGLRCPDCTGDSDLPIGQCWGVTEEAPAGPHPREVAAVLIHFGMVSYGDCDHQGAGWYVGDEQPSRVDDLADFPEWLTEALNAEWSAQMEGT